MVMWLNLPKIKGNNCKACEGTGIKQWFDLDGGPIFHWMKPKTKACDVCNGDKDAN